MTNRLMAPVYVALCLALCWAGKLAYARFHPREAVDKEMTAKDNLAFALSMGAYYLGIILSLGGPLGSASRGRPLVDLAVTAAWGAAALVILNLARPLADRALLPGVDVSAEIVEKGNVAAGLVRAAGTVANALLILGAFGGSGGLLPAVVFWLYGQVWLALAARSLPRILGCDHVAGVKAGNRAVALAAAGAVAAVGNVLRLAMTGDFAGWRPAFVSVTGYAAAGLVCLFLLRELVDWALLPGVTIHQEIVEQKTPNVGVGYLVAVFYLGISVLVGWCL